MKSAKFLIGIALIVFAVVVALGGLTYNCSRKYYGNPEYSVKNVKQDIRVISKEHHSILHPAERERVREYLAASLSRMGGTPEIMYYDSVKSKFSGTFDIGNVYCKFEPKGKDTSSAYLLLMAHLDSRFYENVRGKEVLSYGAADDGYGLGVILELVRKAVKYREDWNQGLKVLFTDAEEHELDGIDSALAQDRVIFENVGLVINIEARGVRGPVLLFETSEGNSELMDFYTKYADMPYTYSLTSAIYSFLPNFTDFTYTRPLFPGYNFSVIGGYECYHTDLDNFSNINDNSIGHYGAQIQPMLKEYLTGDYGSPDYFRAFSDKVVFTVPGLTTFSMSRTMGYVVTAIAFLLFVAVLWVYWKIGAVSIGRVFGRFVRIALWLIMIGAVGKGVAMLAAMISGVPFEFTATKYVQHAELIALSSIGLAFIAYVGIFVYKARKYYSFVYEHLFGGLMLMLLLSVVLLFAVGENLFLVIPVLCAVAALFMNMFVYMNIFSLPALLTVVLVAVSFVYNLLTALTIGSLGVVLVLSLLYMILTVSLFYCYMFQKR